MKLPIRNLLLTALMIAASGLAVALKPTQKIADQRPKIELETMVPKAFGEWQQEEANTNVMVDPQQKEMIDKIYNQTLSRTYRNAQGYHIMFSLAYGGDQSDAMQVHKPEVCYPAQGFTLHEKHPDKLQLGQVSIPITRVSTSLGLRVEPITYWVTIGDEVINSSGIQKKLVEMSYGLSGKIPDGMLIRVSSIDGDTQHAYRMHDQFFNQLLVALPIESRVRLAGKSKSN